jgi:dipeptidyl-peptidase 4
MNACSLALTLFVGIAATASPVAAQSSPEVLAQAEARIRAIYQRNEFGAPPFRGEWLPDGTGYTVRERMSNSSEPVRVAYDAATGQRSVPAPVAEQAPRGLISPDGQRTLINQGGTLWIRDLASDKRTQVGRTAVPKAIRNGRAAWSPNGAWLAFVETDQSKVRMRARIVPGDPSYPEVTEDRFARVGGTIATLRIGVLAAEGGEVRWLNLQAPPEGIYLGQVDWAVNSDELLIEKLSRFRDEREFLLADVRTGELTQIFHESDPAWVVASYGTNSGLTWLGDGAAFLVLSERQGWRQAFVHARDGALLATLTPEGYDIIARAQVDQAGGWFYFYASPKNATQKYLYRVPLDGSKPPVRVTPAGQAGTHDYDIAPGGKWAFHTYSSFDAPPVTELVSLPDHKHVRLLSDRAALHARAAEVIAHPTEFLQLDLPGDVKVDAWMIKPRDFDPARKYPLLVYVYGEPHAQTVLDAWGQSQAHYHRVIADLGYLVVSIDNRGTPAPKGAAWRRACFGSLGPLSTEEQAAAVQELARTRSYVDAERVGIWGWSGGGSNTLNAMFRKPDVYQVGIAVAAKPQPWLYNAWFQEIYMETRETNPEGYHNSAPIHFAEGLQGDLLIMHGTGELNTHVQIIEGLVDRLIELGKPFEYMSYPHRRHGLREGPGTVVHVRMHMIRYWLEHLAPGPR